MTNEELAAIRKRCEKAFTICTPGNPLTGYSVRLRHGFADDLAYDVPALLDHIKELESQLPRWIPVKERLPENWVGVIVYGKEIGVLNNGWTVDGKWFDQTTILDDITHWMPLPEGPEE